MGYLLKIRTSDNRTTEIRRSQGLRVFWIWSLRKLKYFFHAPIGWKLNNYAFFPIVIKDWDVAIWVVSFFLRDHSLMKRKGRCRLPMNLSQTDTYLRVLCNEVNTYIHMINWIKNPIFIVKMREVLIPNAMNDFASLKKVGF